MKKKTQQPAVKNSHVLGGIASSRTDDWAITKAWWDSQIPSMIKSMINHPEHYNKHPSGVECIDVVEHMNFNLGNAVKYIWRADLKDNGPQDLQKAIWYLQRELERRSKI